MQERSTTQHQVSGLLVRCQNARAWQTIPGETVKLSVSRLASLLQNASRTRRRHSQRGVLRCCAAALLRRSLASLAL